ncbi:MAG: Uncharacterised protein [Cryomorphaceae bacterium]|jgi:hypothetical protein|nr:MAG: Uncharacterised protein [Cryomorphaceae bacterium]|tara:strand:- start:2529 stop:3239 length:711 start_codon:yes stop_codon:yes gene_type:complete
MDIRNIAEELKDPNKISAEELIQLDYKRRMNLWEKKLNKRKQKIISKINLELIRINKAEKKQFLLNKCKEIERLHYRTSLERHQNIRRLCRMLINELLYINKLQDDIIEKPQSNKNITFEYKKKALFDSDIGDLFEDSKYLLDDIVTKKIFVSAFSGDKIKTKILWKAGVNELVYYIRKLVENNFIDNNRKWCKTVNTFKLYEKKLVNSELKSVKVNEMKYEKVREINLIFRKFNK